MSAPFDPVQPASDDGIPAADAGSGAPPPAEGFGVGGEEPDRPERTEEDTPPGSPDETPFRTPDPTGDPVDPAVSTATLDPGQTGRDER